MAEAQSADTGDDMEVTPVYDNENIEESVVSENVKAKIKELHSRKEPVNILVVGPTGAGKSTLINTLFGKDMAKVGHGVTSVTSGTDEYEGEFRGIRMKLYDTIGFRDTGGRSDHSILLDIAESGKFDLILICSKLEDRVDRNMFLELASVLNEEMWKRTVIVLTQANRFITLRSVKSGPEVAIRKKIDEYKKYIVDNFSDCVNKEILEDIPICIAGDDEKELPTVDNWTTVFWDLCIDRCSDDVRDFLTVFARYRVYVEILAVSGSTGAGAFAGSVIGAGLGSVVPVAGTVLGAGIGAGVGAGVGGVAGGAISSAIVAAMRFVGYLNKKLS